MARKKSGGFNRTLNFIGLVDDEDKAVAAGERFRAAGVTAVAFDRKGNRLGRGRGYYDRFLCQHLDVKRIGICFDFQLVDEVPAEPFDIRMDEVLTL